MKPKKYIFIFLLIHIFIFMTLAGTNLIIDPFHQFKWSAYPKNEDMSLRANYRLYKLSQYLNQPTENILLGDSRVEGLDVEQIEVLSGEKYTNLAYGGASLREIIDSFWFVVQRKKLKKVYLGLNLSIYNLSYNFNQVAEAKKLIESPLYYLLSPFVFKISYFQFLYNTYGKIRITEQPSVNKEQFWQQQLGTTTQVYYDKYLYPDTYLLELKKISDYCQRNQILLTFIIPPVHMDLQDKVSEYSLDGEYVRFKKDIAHLGDVIDFEFKNEFTQNKNLFTDPYHASSELKQAMLGSIWGSLNPKVSRYIKKNESL